MSILTVPTSHEEAGNRPESPCESTDGRVAYRCEVLVAREPGEEGYSVFAANLPGVVSQGETIDEALCNIAEALEGAIATYLESRDKLIPWSKDQVEVDGEIVCREWILIDA